MSTDALDPGRELPGRNFPPVPTFRRTPELQRLEAALLQTRRELEDARSPARRAPAPLLARCEELFRRACAAAKSRAYYVAYDCLHQIERELVAVRSPEEIDALLCLYRAEADGKLKGWRAGAARSLLDLARDDERRRVALESLMQDVHTALQNRQHKIELRRDQIQAAAWMLFAWATGTFLMTLRGWIDWEAGAQPGATFVQVLVPGTALGILGALLSVAFDLARPAAADTDIPAVRSGWTDAFARPFIGAAVAFPIIVLIRGKLLNLGDGAPALTLAACFLGGFSDRWFLGQLRRVLGASKASEPGAGARGGASGGQSEPGPPRGAGGPLDAQAGREPSFPPAVTGETGAFFRASAGACVTDPLGRVLVLRRRGTPDAWQMPQGGIRTGESPLEAVLRELREETGLGAEQVTVVAEHPLWLPYALPAALRNTKVGLGQVQKWFHLRLTEDAAVHPDGIEFDSFRWLDPAEALAQAADFRRPVYEEVLGCFLSLPQGKPADEVPSVAEDG